MSDNTRQFLLGAFVVLIGVLVGANLYRWVKRPARPATVSIGIVVDVANRTVQPIPWRVYAYRGQRVEWYVPAGDLNIDWKQGQNPSGLADPTCQVSTAMATRATGGSACTVDVPKNAPYDTNHYTVIVTIGGQDLRVDPEVVIQG